MNLPHLSWKEEEAMRPFLIDPTTLSIIVVPLFLILLDVISGIASSVKHRTFQWKMVSDYIGNDGSKYIFAFLVIIALFYLQGASFAFQAAVFLGMGSLSLSIAGSIAENIGELFPPVVAKEIEKDVEEIGKFAYTDPIKTETEMMPSVKHDMIQQHQGTVEVPAASSEVTIPVETVVPKLIINPGPPHGWTKEE